MAVLALKATRRHQLDSAVQYGVLVSPGLEVTSSNPSGSYRDYPVGRFTALWACLHAFRDSFCNAYVIIYIIGVRTANTTAIRVGWSLCNKRHTTHVLCTLLVRIPVGFITLLSTTNVVVTHLPLPDVLRLNIPITHLPAHTTPVLGGGFGYT